MSSTNVVNFSLRQNKSIERSIIIDGLNRMMQILPNDRYIYAGLGSVWFVDFQLAHRTLGIDDMFSIETDEIVYRRALFNKPYKSIKVIHGESQRAIPALLERNELANRPWIVWLDYDKHLDEDRISELQNLVEKLPKNSFILVTFKSTARFYSDKLANRRERLLSLFGDSLVDPLAEDACEAPKLSVTLAKSLSNLLQATSIGSGRKDPFLTTFSIAYEDMTPMVTIGGLLCDPNSAPKIRGLVADPKWTGVVADPISAPPLTLREIWAMRACLPSSKRLDRPTIQRLGFDLSDDAIECFERHYLRFPLFTEITG